MGVFGVVCYLIVNGDEAPANVAALVALFHVSSILMHPLWTLVGFAAQPDESKEGFVAASNVAHQVYTLLSSVFSIWWISIFARFIHPYTLEHGLFGGFAVAAYQLAELSVSQDASDSAVFFFLIDAAFIWLGALVWVASEEGLARVLELTGWSLVIGPAAAILRYF